MIAGASGAVIEGGGEFIDELQDGEPINWGDIAARTVGGGAKGAMFSVPGLSTAKLAAGTVGIATAENYLHSAAKGDMSSGALGKALANGTIEGVTARLVDTVAKKVLGAQPHAGPKPVPEPRLNPYEMLEEHGIPVTLSEEQRDRCDAVGLNMKVEYEGIKKDIVGTDFSEVRPTQNVINPQKVDEYARQLLSGEELLPIKVVEIPGRGKYILNGHHRYVASKQTGIPIEIRTISGEGPIGMPDWRDVELREYVNEDQFWG